MLVRLDPGGARPSTGDAPGSAKQERSGYGLGVYVWKGEYGPDLVNDFAIDFATRHKDKPF